MTRSSTSKPAWAAFPFSAALAVGLLAQAQIAEAREYVITSSSSGCILADAVRAVNTRQTVGSCSAGNGTSGAPDIITLAASSKSLTISSILEIRRSLTIRTNSVGVRHTVTPTAAQDQMILINPIVSGITVRLEDVALSCSATTGIRGSGNDAGDRLVLTRSDVTSCTGTGLDILNMHLDLVDSMVLKNKQRGINFDAWSSRLNIRGSTVALNESPSGEGGGLNYFSNATGTIANSTFAHNSAEAGGAIKVNFGPLNINASTIANNWATDSGGGVVSWGGVSFNQSILADNTINQDSTYPADWGTNGVGISSFTNSMLGHSESYDSFGNHDAVQVSFYGGTNIIDPESSGVRNEPVGYGYANRAEQPAVLGLNPDSPAIDALTSSIEPNDQGNHPRGVFVTSTKTRFDMGAVEFDPDIQAETLFVLNRTGLNTDAGQTGIENSIPSFTPKFSDTSTTGKGYLVVPSSSGTHSITFRLPVRRNDIKQSLVLRLRVGRNYGKYQVALKGTPLGANFVNVGGELDFSRNATSDTTEPVTIMQDTPFSSDNLWEIRFTNTGKHSRSNNPRMRLDAIIMTPL